MKFIEDKLCDQISFAIYYLSCRSLPSCEKWPFCPRVPRYSTNVRYLQSNKSRKTHFYIYMFEPSLFVESLLVANRFSVVSLINHEKVAAALEMIKSNCFIVLHVVI